MPKLKIRIIVNFILALLLIMCSVSNVFAIDSAPLRHIISYDSERKLFQFEKDFLNRYLESELDFGPLFEKEMDRYFKNILSKPKRSISLQSSSKNPEGIVVQSARLDFASCILDYLEDKFIIFNVCTGERGLISKVLTLSELIDNQKCMFNELNNIISLIEEKKTKDFVIANVGTSESVANYLFSSRLFLNPELKRKSEKILITTDPSKRGISKITYNFLNENGDTIFSTKVAKKALGAQFGGIISVSYGNGKEEKLFFKTHQDGSRLTGFTGEIFNSKSVSLAKSVNIRELFVYKLLEKLDLGPEVNFVANPFVPNDIYIVTKDLNKPGETFNMAANVKDFTKFKNNESIILQFTKFDIINRILGINDFNQGNYGILESPNGLFVKIVDFRAPATAIPLSEITFKSFFSANGGLYDNKSLAKKILTDRARKQKIEEGLEALKDINGDKFKEIVKNTKSEIISFISTFDEISGIPIGRQIGLLESPEEDLDIYAETISKNFDIALECLGND